MPQLFVAFLLLLSTTLCEANFHTDIKIMANCETSKKSLRSESGDAWKHSCLPSYLLLQFIKDSCNFLLHNLFPLLPGHSLLPLRAEQCWSVSRRDHTLCKRDLLHDRHLPCSRNICHACGGCPSLHLPHVDEALSPSKYWWQTIPEDSVAPCNDQYLWPSEAKAGFCCRDQWLAQHSHQWKHLHLIFPH